MVTIKQFKYYVEVPVKFISMLKATLPNLEKYIEKLKMNLALLKVLLGQHRFLQIKYVNDTF
jgi:hypothetical protein